MSFNPVGNNGHVPVGTGHQTPSQHHSSHVTVAVGGGHGPSFVTVQTGTQASLRVSEGARAHMSARASSHQTSEVRQVPGTNLSVVTKK